MDWSSGLMNADSFPCIICGKGLERANENYEQQPSGGIITGSRCPVQRVNAETLGRERH